MRKLIALLIVLIGVSLPSCDLTSGDGIAPEQSKKLSEIQSTEGEEDVTGQSGND